MTAVPSLFGVHPAGLAMMSVGTLGADIGPARIGDMGIGTMGIGTIGIGTIGIGTIGIGTIGIVGLCLAAAAFAVLSAAFAVVRPRLWRPGLAAGLATAAWAAGEAMTAAGLLPGPAAGALEMGRTAAWLVFLGALLGPAGVRVLEARQERWGALAAGAVLAWAALEVGAGMGLFGDTTVRLLVERPLLSAVARLVAAVAALLLIENLFRNSDGGGRWAIKFLCFGAALLFAYDVFLFADATLMHRIDPGLRAARGFIATLAAPLLAVALARAHVWPNGLRLSRVAVFHTVALMGSGVYLMAMALLGLTLHQAGGSWGPVFQVLFLTAAGMLLAAIFASGAARARVQVLIAKHFFPYRHDYREVWLGFVRALGAPAGDPGREDSGAGAGGLHDRIIRAMGAIVDSPAGALWVRRAADDAFVPVAAVAFGGGDLPVLSAADPLVGFLDGSDWIAELDPIRAGDPAYGALVLPPGLLHHPRARLAVPLRHRKSLCALLVLDAPRSGRAVDWEDFDILRTAGAHAGSAIAEAEARDALADARRLHEFNQRLAFAVHDVKTVIGQLSLMLANAQRHGDDPAFRRDMLMTVGHAVDRMCTLVDRLRATGSGDTEARETRPGDLAPVLGQVAETWRRGRPDLAIDLDIALDPQAPTVVVADPGAVRCVLDHLVSNAIEATEAVCARETTIAVPAGGAMPGRDGTGSRGRIILRLRRDAAGTPTAAVIEVEDHGPGMDPAFVRDRLFRPLGTTKAGGFGLGAWQAQEMVRAMGGRLEVRSVPGRGTVMRIRLPVAPVPAVTRAPPTRDHKAGGPPC